MPHTRRISIAPHLSTEQLQQAYQQAKDGLETRQYQIIWLLALGKTTEEVQKITGYSRIWIYELVKRYNQLGLEGLGDRRQKNTGGQPLIGDVQQAQLLFLMSISNSLIGFYRSLLPNLT